MVGSKRPLELEGAQARRRELVMLDHVHMSTLKVDQIRSTHLELVASAESGPVGGRGKRAFDFIFAAIGLALFAPLLAFVSLLVKCTSSGPVFFLQKRIGYQGRHFPCYKFRTMVVDADVRLRLLLESDPSARAEWEANQKLRCDPRVTWIGQVLRLGSIDELPQLINVLCGHMSLVGPRPIVDEEIARYREKFADYRRARPGITGVWQVSGRNDIPFEERTEIDRSYVRNWSFLGDMKIILRTLPAVLLSKGCY
jgi:exopolysaccharide production protein ExoY